ncbi:DEAD/DEAH box helicase [Streptomyces sp. NPDC006134]|uniref:DEAD/DEAH box helicase n=1 Tax=Streptomyces sp. NPDC006134 TaxID=3154467 RepID=UPI0034105172
MTLPVALTGTDVIGQAKTGTGKTLGFGLPLLERVTVPADVEAGRAEPEALTDAPQALVVVPTRELCTQVTNDLLTAGKVRNVRVVAIYGGRAYEPQVEALKKGVDVVVGTPGRLLDLAGQKKLDLKHIKCLVLDEADEMLDLGFLPDVEKIIGMLPAKRQTMLFSATMPGAVIGLARRYMSQPTHIRATAPDDEGATVANIKQFVYRAHSMDKPEMIARILQAEGRGLAMIFCRTKRTAADIAEQLQRRGFAAGAVHGDLGQGAREQALRAFRNGKVDVLVCTDVAARGIDVEGVTHVINYQSPEDEKTYLHRVGRTGRAGAKGTAITFVDWDDIPRWQLINKALELDFNDPVETYSTSPHLFSDLGIPEGTKGVLPRSARTRAGLDAEELEDLGEPGGRGGRGRGGRDERGGRGGRGDRADSRSDDRERSARTPRRRRRTRGGAPLDAATAGTATQDAVPAGDTQGTAEADAAKPARTLRRRRRTRNGAPTQQPVTAETTATAAEGTALEVAEAAAETPAAQTAVDVAPEAAEAPAQPRRRRTRKTAEAPAAEAPAIETPVSPAPAEEAVASEEAPATKPHRRTRKAAEAPETTEAPEATETKPRRTRKATAKTETTPDDTAETTEAPKPRRTRKTAAKAETPETAETAETPEATEAPKPRRTRKATAKAETPETAEAPDTTEAKPRRRTRKAAEAPETTEAPEATETKPRRTRKATAKTETTPDDTAETTEAPKPRRTRKTAAKAETPETAETAETPEATEAPKPRRTRKATAKAETPETAEAPDTTEAKPRRRTRKAAEAAEAEPGTAGIPAQATQEPEAAPRRRTRKAAATAEAGDAAEAKPKVRRTRKATAAAAPSVESVES